MEYVNRIVRLEPAINSGDCGEHPFIKENGTVSIRECASHTDSSKSTMNRTLRRLVNAGHGGVRGQRQERGILRKQAPLNGENPPLLTMAAYTVIPKLMTVVRHTIAFLMILFAAGCAHERIVPSAVVSGGNCTFAYTDPQAETVSLVGSFNNWDRTSVPMKRVDRGTWAVSVRLPRGVYYYQFVVDGRTWVVPPYADAYAPDGFGERDAVVVVGDGLKGRE